MESFQNIYDRCTAYYWNYTVARLKRNMGEPAKELFGEADLSHRLIKYGDYIEENDFSGRDVVLPVGELHSGTREWTKVFLKAHPQFEYFSFWDEGILTEEMKYKKREPGKKFHLYDPTGLCYDFLMEVAQKMTEFINKSKGQIIIYAYFMNVPTRASFIKYLRQFGFKIHIVYFPFECLMRNFMPNIKKSAVEEYLYDKYTQSFRKRYWEEGRSAELWDIRLNIIELICKKMRVRPDEIYEEYINNQKVQQIISRDIYVLRKHYVFCESIEQDWEELFFEGADRGYLIDTGDFEKNGTNTLLFYNETYWKS